MPKSTPSDPSAPDIGAFDTRTMVELGQHGLFDRVMFAGVFAVISLLVLPWMAVAGWFVMIGVWEWGINPVLDRAVLRMPESRASAVYALCSVVASALYQVVAFACLAKGSALGVAIGATWIGGAVLNAFVYSSASLRLLIATLAPAAGAAVVGPWLAYGVSWNALAIPVLLALSGLASRRFSLDHGALLGQLADRQVAFADVERKLSVAIEASGDGLFELDFIADELSPNATWLAMLGYGPDEIETPVRNWRGMIHPDDLPGLTADYAAHVRGETPHTACEVRMRCKDGDYKWVLPRARLVSRAEDGRPWRMIGTTMDLSARKALEHQLEAARDVAESANHAKSVFVANMSHEIRTPLNGVIGVAGALAGTELSEPQREMLGLIESSGQMLERILSDILDQAKIEAGNFQLQIAPFDLRAEIEAAAELMRARANEKGLGFSTDYGEDALGLFEGDAVRVRQIVSNLASNAIKFTAEGTVTITVAASGGQGAGDPATIRIDVADSGIGFDVETANRLFSRFVQADGSISRQFGGTGLGLAICKQLTDLMQGQITVKSVPGSGSVFAVALPLARSVSLADYRARPVGVVQRREPAAASGEDLSRVHILLAEDHPTNQRVVQLILEPTGIALTIVGNGQEAVEAFRPGLYDLILMDMQMPVMDGLTATRAIRELERKAGCAATPIAMFTANAMDEHLALAAEAGANHHISKPITPERLLAGIELALGAAESEPVAAVRSAG
jgi:two-component system, sensor histidine kinase